MSEDQDLGREEKRRKALAKLRITKSVDKNATLIPSTDSPTKNVKPEPQSEKESIGMIFLGAMLTLTSVMLVSLCFITTMNSYDRALNEANIAPTIIANDNNGGGPLINYPYPNMHRMANPQYHQWRMLMREERFRL